jgi:hypothetical protein
MKYFIIFLLGTAIGALGMLVVQPTFTCVLTNVPANTHTIKSTATIESPVSVLPPLKKEDEAPAPVVIKEEEITPIDTTAKIETKDTVLEKSLTDNLPKLDFTAINERPNLWPSSVKVVVNTLVPLLEKNKKIADMPLSIGDTLQVSKVYGDGKLEVRAKNLKFEIDSNLTNFEIQIREKIKELAAQGNGFIPPYVRVGENSNTPQNTLGSPKNTNPVLVTVPVAAPKSPNPPAVETVVEEPVVEKKAQSLDDKMNALFSQGSSTTEKDKTKPKNTKK